MFVCLFQRQFATLRLVFHDLRSTLSILLENLIAFASNKTGILENCTVFFQIMRRLPENLASALSCLTVFSFENRDSIQYIEMF